MMEKNHVILKLYQNRIWFNGVLSLEMTSANLPSETIGLNPHSSVFWLVEQISFDKNTCTLEVKVVDYFLRDVISFSTQQPKATVKAITFLNLPEPDNLKLALKYYSRQMKDLDRALEEGYEGYGGIESKQSPDIPKINPLFRTYEEREKLDV
jgi:hypothetical protein